MYANPPTWESAPEEPNMIVGTAEVTESQQRTEQAEFFPLRSLPHIQWQQRGLPRPGEHPRLQPLLHNRCAETKKIKAQMKEQIKSPEKIQVSD